MSECKNPTYEQMLEYGDVLHWIKCLLCENKVSCWNRLGGFVFPYVCGPCKKAHPSEAESANKSYWEKDQKTKKEGRPPVTTWEPFQEERYQIPCEKCGAKRCELQWEEYHQGRVVRLHLCWECFYGPSTLVQSPRKIPGSEPFREWESVIELRVRMGLG